MAVSDRRMSAAERREVIVAVATRHFAQTGFSGTSTSNIAEEVGISQPYLFALFESKKALFLECLRSGHSRIWETFSLASTGLSGEEALCAMGESYHLLLQDTALLGIQLQGYAASADPEIREVNSSLFLDLWKKIIERSRLDPAEVSNFLAMGMMLNVTTVLGLSEVMCAFDQPEV